MAHIILTGPTGLVGSAVLLHALQSPSISKLTILSRRPVALAASNPKATVIIHPDFTSYPPTLLSSLSDATACIWAQGISSVGMKENDYRVITKDYPLAAAEAFKTLPSVAKGKEGGFKFIYISGRGADQSGNASQMFGRVKGETEKRLLETAAENPGFTVYNLRPAAIDPGKNWTAERSKMLMEKVFFGIAPLIRPLVKSFIIPVDKLATVSVDLAVGRGEKATGQGVSEDGFTLENDAIRRLAGL